VAHCCSDPGRRPRGGDDPPARRWAAPSTAVLIPDPHRAIVAAVGITVTEDGKARARARLAEAEAAWTPERWTALREQLGLSGRAA
jgi:hypothetical protein